MIWPLLSGHTQSGAFYRLSFFSANAQHRRRFGRYRPVGDSGADQSTLFLAVVINRIFITIIPALCSVILVNAFKINKTRL